MDGSIFFYRFYKQVFLGFFFKVCLYIYGELTTQIGKDPHAFQTARSLVWKRIQKAAVPTPPVEQEGRAGAAISCSPPSSHSGVPRVRSRQGTLPCCSFNLAAGHKKWAGGFPLLIQSSRNGSTGAAQAFHCSLGKI